MSDHMCMSQEHFNTLSITVKKKERKKNTKQTTMQEKAPLSMTQACDLRHIFIA